LEILDGMASLEYFYSPRWPFPRFDGLRAKVDPLHQPPKAFLESLVEEDSTIGTAVINLRPYIANEQMATAWLEFILSRSD
jgi:hypothetical protein